MLGRLGGRARLRRRCRLIGQGELERGVLHEDAPLELVQGAAGLDAELIDERSARFLVGSQCLCLTAAAVEREHLRAADPLAQGVLLRESRDLGHDLCMPSQLEVGLDALLQGAEPLLFQPRDRRLRERVVGEVCKRRPAPQRERLVQPVRGTLRIRSRRLVAQPLEAVEVEPAGLDPQHVPGRPRHDHVGAERPAQL